MEGVIRHLTNDKEDLVVITEHGFRQWQVKKYIQGITELEDLVRKYFKRSVSLPINQYGRDSLILNSILEQGVEIQTLESDDRDVFLGTFVDGVLLAAHPGLSWEDYLEYSSDSPACTQGELGHWIEAFVSKLRDSPNLIGLPPEGNFFREVRLNNALWRRFRSYRQFQRYCIYGFEPVQGAVGIAQPDLMYDSDIPRVIEIKCIGSTSQCKTRHATGNVPNKQLQLSHHFLSRNFAKKPELVSVQLHGIDPQRIRVLRYSYDERTDSFIFNGGENWRNI
ncbi:MAG: hypothetical protein IIA87_00300 [Nanoarchaeota archaeon]|nr:hypothetical protein [Nanoarchaeota archaeon]